MRKKFVFLLSHTVIRHDALCVSTTYSMTTGVAMIKEGIVDHVRLSHCKPLYCNVLQP